MNSRTCVIKNPSPSGTRTQIQVESEPKIQGDQNPSPRGIRTQTPVGSGTPSQQDQDPSPGGLVLQGQVWELLELGFGSPKAQPGQ